VPTLQATSHLHTGATRLMLVPIRRMDHPRGCPLQAIQAALLPQATHLLALGDGYHLLATSTSLRQASRREHHLQAMDLHLSQQRHRLAIKEISHPMEAIMQTPTLILSRLI
jgi:hypothetical protein